MKIKQQMPSRRLQGRPKTFPKRPQDAPRRPKTPPRRLQDASKTTPRRLPDGPRYPQNATKTALNSPRHPKMLPRRPKTPSRRLQDATRCAQDVPRGLHDAILVDLGSQNGAKLTPKTNQKSRSTLKTKNQLNASRLVFSWLFVL